MSKQPTSLRNREILVTGRPITDKGYIGRIKTPIKSKISKIRINQKGSSFNPTKQCILGYPSLEDMMSKRIIRKKDKSRGGIHHLTYIIKTWSKKKMLDINLRDARQEAWSLMVSTSQTRGSPKPNKNTRTATIQGAQTAIFEYQIQAGRSYSGQKCLLLSNQEMI